MTLLDPQHESDFKAHLDRFEGKIPWPYVDTTGHVTVGVGCMIPSLSEFESMKWEGGIGTVSLLDEWRTLKAATPGLMAAAYKSLTSLVLPNDEIDRLRDQRIASMESDVIQAVPGVSALPQNAIQCVCDMAFNLGVSKLHSEFFAPGCHFGPAVFAGDWQAAAKECIRRGIQKERNDYTQALFMGIFPLTVS